MMDQLTAFLTTHLEAITLLAIFGTVVFSVIAVITLVRGRRPIQERLAGTNPSGGHTETDAVSLRRGSEGTGAVGRALKSVEQHILPSNTDELTEARKTMMRAGYESANALRIYYALRFVFGIVLPILILLLSPELSRTMDWRRIAVIAAACGLVGMYAPTAWISSRTKSRQAACRDGFPDALDMLLVSVEAGLGLDAAINRVAAEIGAAHPVLGEHFRRVGAELRAGRSREAALRNMADQIGIEEVGSLVTLLIQSDMLGTSIAQALRVHADGMRIQRLMRAEEKAHMLPVKMTVPLILGILPPLVLVIMAPAIIGLLNALGHHG